ncbi:MAG: hypothetical protein IJX67_01400 [Oscillospiraceae bacterium]|nr:hypothetical protein [Oscillospiraceae bacterium]
MTKTTPMMEVTRRYGHTVYTIIAFGNPDSAHTYEDRLLNLIQHEADKMDSCKESPSTSTTDKENN